MEPTNALTAQDVAERLHVSKGTVYNLVNSGSLGHYKVGRKLRFTESAVTDYIKRFQSEDLSLLPDTFPWSDPGSVRRSRESFIICGQDLLLDVLSNYMHLHNIPALRYYIGSYDSLICLYKNKVSVASTHLWDGAKDEYNIAFVKRLLAGTPVVIIHMACRTQGFYVRKGNPKQINTWRDLLRSDVVLINREYGSGSRVLLDEKLKLLGVYGNSIKGYNRSVNSHLAIASAISGGQADVGVGIEKVARQVDNIEFIPLKRERYDIVYKKENENLPEIQIMRQIIASPAYRQEITNVGGYDTAEMGNLVAEV
ncbi:MAG: helix-turn-helix transcriptional regulator [Gracilibacteraceae bacterium]|jgi:putative molybdopterin biosynthesis protein|nr:helix-turn-helix transcriptional regulator [Gracilibacteraceae bacterium]